MQERGVTKGQRELLGVMDMFRTLTEVIVSWICIYVCQNLSNYAFQMSALYYVSISKKMLKIKSTCVKNLNTKLKKKFENKKIIKRKNYTMEVSLDLYMITQRLNAPFLVGAQKPILARPSMVIPG